MKHPILTSALALALLAGACTAPPDTAPDWPGDGSGPSGPASWTVLEVLEDGSLVIESPTGARLSACIRDAICDPDRETFR